MRALPALVFVIAFVVRLVHIWQIKPSPFFDVLLGDAGGYDEWARRLAGGDWIGSDVFYQAPLYPYFLGVLYKLFGHDLLIVRICQAAIGSASCALLALAGGRLFSPRVGLIAGLALALYAPAVFFDALLQKSVLDMFFVCLSIWLVSRILAGSSTRASWIALGLAMGALALTRENALSFIAVIVVFAVVQKGSEGFRGVLKGSDGFGKVRKGSNPSEPFRTLQNHSEPFRTFQNLGWFVVGLAVVLLPVAIRNYSVGGGLYLTTSQFGSNFYIGNHAGADGTYASIRFGRGAPEFERQDATEVAEQAVGRSLTPSEVSAYWTDRALLFITSQPAEWIALTGRKIRLLVNRSEMLDTESQESYAEWSWPLRIGGWIGHFGVLVPLALLGVMVTWPERRRLWILYAMAIAYAASVVMFYVFARYRYPLVPFLLLFAAAGVALPFDSTFREYLAKCFAQGSRRWQLAAISIAVTIFANWPVLSSTLMMAITENNLGTALQDAKRYDEAVVHHERAVALQPDYAPAYNNLGAALRAAGRLDEAVAQYQKALALKPDFGNASYNLANALLERGQAGASVDEFRKAIQLTPDSVQAHNNLGIALAAKGDAAGAMAEFRAAIALDGTSVQAHRNLGNMLVDRGERAEGMAHLERAVQVAPGEADALFDIGSILLQEQDFKGAAGRFQAALQIKPDSPETLNNLGIAFANQGKIADALTYFERALSLRPNFNDARVNRDQARAVLKK
ncbi:MAG: tetratricopeptide repeat protein [Acidobacteriota bacterium]|nr:tetratricopeptide repeat protein [Acidobacteriota bacterium]